MKNIIAILFLILAISINGAAQNQLQYNQFTTNLNNNASLNNLVVSNTITDSTGSLGAGGYFLGNLGSGSGEAIAWSRNASGLTNLTAANLVGDISTNNITNAVAQLGLSSGGGVTTNSIEDNWLYVSYSRGSDTNGGAGTKYAPFLTLTNAAQHACQFNPARGVWMLDGIINSTNDGGLGIQYTNVYYHFDMGCVATNNANMWECDSINVPSSQTNLFIDGELKIYNTKVFDNGPGPFYIFAHFNYVNTTNTAINSNGTFIGDGSHWVTNFLYANITCTDSLIADEDVDPADPTTNQECVRLVLNAGKTILWQTTVGYTGNPDGNGAFFTILNAPYPIASKWNRPGGDFIVNGGLFSKYAGSFAAVRCKFNNCTFTNMSVFPGTGTAYGSWNVGYTNYTASLNGITNQW